VNCFYEYEELPEKVIRGINGDVRGIRDADGKDIVLGGLFPVHDDKVGGADCGEIRKEKGLERMEAMLYAIDLINNDTSLLPGITIGYDIRDTCNSENIGLDETIDIVINGQQLDIESCTTQSAQIAANSSETIPATLAVIGAASSGVSVPVATLLRLFKIPQISYASTSARLNNRDRYEYFYRTIPADNLQAEAMIDLCLIFNWSYVSVIYTNNFYGEAGIDEFRKLAKIHNICIKVDIGIEAHFEDDNFRSIADELLASDKDANVVVLFASSADAGKLFRQINESNVQNGTNRTFVWLASDAWAKSNDIVNPFNSSLVGHFGVIPQTEVDEKFSEYFLQLTLESNKRNPWFKEYYKAVSGCDNSTCPQDKPITPYRQGDKIPLVIDAVYSIAYAIQNFLNDECSKNVPDISNCSRVSLNQLTGPILLEYLKNVSFISSTSRRISFDANGNAEGIYEIINHQLAANGEYTFESVALWNSSNVPGYRLSFNINESSLQFGLGNNGKVLTSRESQCQVCQIGQRREVIRQGECCVRCENCLGGNFSNSTSATECEQCPNDMWGNNPLNGSSSCIPIQQVYVQFQNVWAIILMIIAFIGILSVIFVVVIMAIYWNTPMVKSSGREQMITLLVGILLAFLSTFVFVSPPSVPTCLLQRLSLWISFSIILGALLIKLIRIARIFLRNNKSSRPRFTQPRYQILFTLIVVIVQLILVVISLATIHPVPLKETQNNAINSNDFPTLLVSCQYPDGAMLAALVVYDTIIIVICNVLAIMTIKFPDNFNESKHVAFSTFAIGVIWLSFISSYIATQHDFRTAVVSYALNMTGFAVLLCMFGPRIFIILFLPERNTKNYSTRAANTNITTSADNGTNTTNDTLSTNNKLMLRRLSQPLDTVLSTNSDNKKTENEAMKETNI
jgi:metabotropic glutamate receptor 2/3/metabotropic glutamate receptor 6/7/8